MLSKEAQNNYQPNLPNMISPPSYEEAFECYLKSAEKFVISSSFSSKVMAYVKLSPIVYRWAIQKFGATSEPVKLLFYDILRARIAIRPPNLESESSDNNSPSGQVKKLYDEFSNGRVPYSEMHLSLLAKTDDNDLLLDFFDKYLPKIYNKSKKRKNANLENLEQKWNEILFSFHAGEKTRLTETDFYGHLIKYDIESSAKFLDKIQTFKLREDVRYSHHSEQEEDGGDKQTSKRSRLV
ncbi:6095_t:CDS:2 [Ambispora gerdemannii]|uniref:6095_t:CDS:1 n=1 Tax=Ambispora gerdemannii TaxID=144530 RepID=A0A9N9GXJ7_9GLOM|nr:6095_t:CDS:2 [Ambispora gerdemannii]